MSNENLEIIGLTLQPEVKLYLVAAGNNGPWGMKDTEHWQKQTGNN